MSDDDDKKLKITDLDARQQEVKGGSFRVRGSSGQFLKAETDEDGLIVDSNLTEEASNVWDTRK